MTRKEKEQQVIALMIRMYCYRKLHQKEISEEYLSLLKYAQDRLSHCPFGENKTTCKRCRIHCYRKEEREQIRMVMRWCGPRMLLYHPIIAIRHLLHK